MKKTASLAAVSLVMALLPSVVLAEDTATPEPAAPAAPATTANGVRIDGAEIGQWTHDWDAALALAKEKDVPVFALFTGSDWCPYCVKLHDRIFAKDGWKDWAKDNVVLAYVDMPNDKTLVPEKFQKRNGELCARYSVEGFPTAYLLSVDTDEPVMAFSYSDEDTPESFAKDVADVLPLARHDGFRTALSEEDWKRYGEAQKSRKEWEKKAREILDRVQPKAEELEKAGKKPEEILDALKDDIAEVKKVQEKLSAANRVLGALTQRAIKKASGRDLSKE